MNEACSRCPLVINCVTKNTSIEGELAIVKDYLNKFENLEISVFLDSIVEDEENKNIKLMLDRVQDDNLSPKVRNEIKDLNKRTELFKLSRQDLISDLRKQIDMKKQRIELLQDDRNFYDDFVHRLLISCQKGPSLFNKKCRSQLVEQ